MQFLCVVIVKRIIELAEMVVMSFKLFSKGLTSQTHHLQKLGEKGGGNCSTGGSSAMGLLELEVFCELLPLH